MKRVVNLAMTILTAASLWGMQGCPVFPIDMAVEETAELSISILGCNETTQPQLVLIGAPLSWNEEDISFGEIDGSAACTFQVSFSPSVPSLYRLRISTTRADGVDEGAAEAFAQASRPPVFGGSRSLSIVIEGGPDEDRVVSQLTIESMIVGGNS
ncbi:MAG: hypothetical protein D6812_06670 [Deltaproteobacteria bacterium]|nr:MAG: hypothetical protein D6812_06670 [Deltaproteobacteria bacterium]